MRTNDRGRPGPERPQSVTVGDTSRVQEPTDYLDHFARRVLLDAINEATADYWRRRAKALRAARHRPGDYLPDGQLQAARAKWRQLTEAAAACEAKAAFIERYGAELFAHDVASVLGEEANAA
ncbi:MAG: hypothetical protein KDB38_07435 [Nocardioidaceae bacterium]|nr:hypothetical protein [Nocardioidaceae bacterium]